MRQVFTSPRLANVEEVAKLLEEAGIATKISNGRSYRGKFDRGFSYRTTGQQAQAAVWVVNSEDQPRARAMLREAGLLDSTRPDQQRDRFLPEHLRAGAAPVAATRWLSPGRLKIGLLAAIALVIALTMFWQRRTGTPTAVPVAAGGTAPTIQGPDVLPARTVSPIVQRVDVPSALAALLVTRAANERDLAEACVHVDGDTPSERTRELLAAQAKAPALADIAACGEGTTLTRIVIDDYRTDGSGVGTVRMRLYRGAMRIDQRFEVERRGHDWRVTGSSRP